MVNKRQEMKEMKHGGISEQRGNCAKEEESRKEGNGPTRKRTKLETLQKKK